MTVNKIYAAPVYMLWDVLRGLTCILSSPSDCQTNKCQQDLNIILLNGDSQNCAIYQWVLEVSQKKGIKL